MNKKNNILKIGFVITIVFGVSGINFTSCAENPGSSPYEYPKLCALFFCPFIAWYDELEIFQEVLESNGWERNNFIELIGSNATRHNLDDAFEVLNDLENYQDTVLICISTHGNQTGTFQIHYNYNISYILLNDYLDSLDSMGIAVIIDACRSGSAIESLSADGRVIATSCRPVDTFCVIGEFTKYMAYGLDVFGDYRDGSPDYWNGDGVVSMREAFEFVNSSNEGYGGFGNRPFFEDCYPKITCNQVSDLHMTFQNWSDGRVDEYPLKVTKGSNSLLVHRFQNESGDNIFKAAQKFTTAEYDYLTKIRISMYRCNNPNLSLNIIINEGSESGPEGNYIGNETIDSSDWDDLEKGYYKTVNFNPDLPTSARSHYFVLDTEEGFEDDNNKKYVILKTLYGYKGPGYCCWKFYNRTSEDWQSEMLFDIQFVTYGKDGIGKNEPPYIPRRPYGPSSTFNSSIEKNYAFTEDVEGDVIYYKFNWGDGNETGWIDSRLRFPFYASHKWNHSGTYFVKVQATDDPKSPGVDRWSDVFKVRVSG